ncbi:hypothetical protein M3691_37880, partial [Paenibacillus elgii]|nr:hypothetical protein [Paenibacillus elgii]
TRILVGFETEDENSVQEIVDKAKIKQLLGTKNLEAFKKKIEETVKLQSEKFILLETAREAKLNDLDKVRFIEDFTGIKFEE